LGAPSLPPIPNLDVELSRRQGRLVWQVDRQRCIGRPQPLVGRRQLDLCAAVMVPCRHCTAHAGACNHRPRCGGRHTCACTRTRAWARLQSHHSMHACWPGSLHAHACAWRMHMPVTQRASLLPLCVPCATHTEPWRVAKGRGIGGHREEALQGRARVMSFFWHRQQDRQRAYVTLPQADRRRLPGGGHRARRSESMSATPYQSAQPSCRGEGQQACYARGNNTQEDDRLLFLSETRRR
jgi:hypothetical protein